MLFTSSTSLRSPLEEKNLELENAEETHKELDKQVHGCDKALANYQCRGLMKSVWKSYPDFSK